VKPSRFREVPSKSALRETAHSDSSIVNEEPTAIENIIMQSIVSGILMLFVLAASLTNFAPAAELREGLRNMLAGAETPAELLAEVRHLSGLEFSSEVSQIFPDFPEFPAFPEVPVTPEQPPTAEAEPSNPQIPGPLVVPGLWE
jgi:hypothetical protein